MESSLSASYDHLANDWFQNLTLNQSLHKLCLTITVHQNEMQNICSVGQESSLSSMEQGNTRLSYCISNKTMKKPDWAGGWGVDLYLQGHKTTGTAEKWSCPQAFTYLHFYFCFVILQNFMHLFEPN